MKIFNIFLNAIEVVYAKKRSNTLFIKKVGPIEILIQEKTEFNVVDPILQHLIGIRIRVGSSFYI